MSNKIRRSYKGAAQQAVLDSSGVSSSTQTSLVLSTSPSTWPTGKFFVVVAPGTAQEEKMCVALSDSTLTVVDPDVVSNSASVNGRGVDNTTARSTIAGGAVVYPVFTATDADEANELTSTYTTQGDLVYQGASTFTRLGLAGTAGHVLKANSGLTAPEWGQVGSTGIADSAVTTDKINNTAVTAAKIASAVAGNGLTGGAGTALAVNVDDSTIEINSDSLRLKDGGVTLAKLATAVVNRLVPVGTIAMYGGASAPTGWLLCDGSSIDAGYTALRAIVGNNTPDFKGRFALGDNATLTLLGTGGSVTIGINNLPAHSHANTAALNSGTVSISDPGHGHTGTVDSAGSHSHPQEVESTSVTGESHSHGISGTAGGTDGSNTEGNDQTGQAGAHQHTFTTTSVGTGITASVGTGITVTNAQTGGGEAYYQPHLVVNYIIKHD
jgi:microcystin-dependent protein